ncbi:unnamed protein product [marine sediment metagenome]|uniref:Uncharacterized protein n=1 Tax=marine sediment metagenome TaxID=412755 RepID=X0YDV8_9ZZZZ
MNSLFEKPVSHPAKFWIDKIGPSDSQLPAGWASPTATWVGF